MINKRISKITMLTALFVAGIVNAQEFYTCVPKKSWWKDTMTDSVKTAINESKLPKWKLIKELQVQEITIPLTFGKYKLEYIGRTSDIYEFKAFDNQSIKIIFEEGELTVDDHWKVSTPGKDIEIYDFFVLFKLYKYE